MDIELTKAYVNGPGYAVQLRDELKAIWNKYAPQRQAEHRAAEITLQANRELHELNQRRMAIGLPMVSEYREQRVDVSTHIGVWPAQAKTWRDDMHQEILVAVRKHFETADKVVGKDAAE